MRTSMPSAYSPASPPVRQPRVVQAQAAMPDTSSRAAQLNTIQTMMNASPHHQHMHAVQKKMNGRVIQRRVTIKGQPIDSIIRYLSTDEWNTFLSMEEAGAAGWMLGINQTLDFKDQGDLILYVTKVWSVAKLLRSIFTSGILSRNLLSQRNIDYIGSEDTGKSGGLAVNVLDNRDENVGAQQIADDSMTATQRGSISVAMERENDWVKHGPDDDKFGEWSKPQHIALTPSQEKQVKEAELVGGPSLGSAVRHHNQESQADTNNTDLLNNLYRPEMDRRAQNTVMAIIRKPGSGVATSVRSGTSYESSVSSGAIQAGPGGFEVLLIPAWFQPFYLMLKDAQPKGLEVRFVGDKTITAHYKNPGGGHLPVTVNAPDYTEQITPELQQFKLLATHILTA